MPEPPTSAHELVFSRIFAAPIATVFRAWTDPEQLVHWWGPKDFSLTINEMDLRVGGIWDYVLHGPDGTDYPSRAVFEVIEPPTRLAFFNRGGHVNDAHLTCRMIATFHELEPDNGKARTSVVLRLQFESLAALETAQSRGAEQGGQESFARLADLLQLDSRS